MEMLVKAYGDAARNRTALHKWYSRIRKCDVRTAQRTSDVNNVTENSGNQRTQNNLKELDKDRRITVEKLASG